MKSLKGFFYMKSGKYREALDFFNEGTNHNPYLYFSESYKAFSHLNLKIMIVHIIMQNLHLINCQEMLFILQIMH